MQGILFRILEHGSCKLYKISSNRNEYETFKRTLSGKNKMSNIEPQMVNDSLMESFTSKLSGIKEVFLIHDPSDIRKPHSHKTENLGKVRDLENNIINGYSSYNVVAIMSNDKSVNLLSHRSYSNKEPRFLKTEIIEKLESGKTFEDEETARKLYESGNYINKKIIAKDELSRVSKGIKSSQTDIKITHILDREFDDDEYHELIHKELNDYFVARAKKSRTINERSEDGKKVRLIQTDFSDKHIYKAQKMQFKDKVYQDVQIVIEWCDYNHFKALRITINDRKGKAIFPDPMLLMTNKDVVCADDAYNIYLTYLKRAKIEYVFRFLKDALGWEEIQVRDFKSIQNLLSISFYVSAYLYEIGDEITYDDYSINLAGLGGGKGKVTRYYIFEGIKLLLGKFRVDRYFEEIKLSKNTQEGMKKVAGVDLVIE